MEKHELLQRPKPVKSNRVLYEFSKKEIPIVGELHTNLKCGNSQKSVTFILVDTHEGENLCGYDLLKTFGFQIRQINSIKNEDNGKMSDICEKFHDVFEPSLGTMIDYKIFE